MDSGVGAEKSALNWYCTPGNEPLEKMCLRCVSGLHETHKLLLVW